MSERKMATGVYGVEWLPWRSRPKEVNTAYDLLWSNVPPPKGDGKPWSVVELQGNMLYAILAGIDYGIRLARMAKEKKED